MKDLAKPLQQERYAAFAKLTEGYCIRLYSKTISDLLELTISYLRR